MEDLNTLQVTERQRKAIVDMVRECAHVAIMAYLEHHNVVSATAAAAIRAALELPNAGQTPFTVETIPPTRWETCPWCGEHVFLVGDVNAVCNKCLQIIERKADVDANDKAPAQTKPRPNPYRW